MRLIGISFLILLLSCCKSNITESIIKNERIKPFKITWSNPIDSSNLSVGGLSATPVALSKYVFFSDEIHHSLNRYDTIDGSLTRLYENNFFCLGDGQLIQFDSIIFYNNYNGKIESALLDGSGISQVFNFQGSSSIRISKGNNKVYFNEFYNNLVKAYCFDINDKSLSNLFNLNLGTNDVGNLEAPLSFINNSNNFLIYNLRFQDELNNNYSTLILFNEDSNSIEWTLDFTNPLNFPSSTIKPTIVGNYAYVANSTTILKVNLTNGQIEWEKGSNDPIDQLYFGHICHYQGDIIVKKSNGGIFSLDANTGKLNWEVHDDGSTTLTSSFFQYDNELVYFTSTINIVDLASGNYILKLSLNEDQYNPYMMLQEFLYFRKSRKFFFHNFISVKGVQLDPFN